MMRVIRKYINYALDIILLLSGLVSIASSYVTWFILPRGIGLHGDGAAHCGGAGTGVTGNTESFLEMCRYSWIEIHNWASVVLAIIVIIHLFLHWRWIFETTKRFSSHLRKHTRKVLELYGAVVVLFVLFVFDCLSGLVLWLVLPRGARDYNLMINDSGRTFLGLQRIVWLDLHAWVAVTIVAIILIHLILNWDWVVLLTKKLFRGSSGL
jgi:hypothetical protein